MNTLRYRNSRYGMLLVLFLGVHGAALADALTPSLNPFANAPLASPAPPARPAPTTGPAPHCTIAVIVEDVGTNDTYLGRMRFLAPEAPLPGKPAICPGGAAQEAARRTLEKCKQHASNPFDCVYADMGHMFGISTDIVDTSPLSSQCPSYLAKFIGIACQAGLAEDVCNIGCGATAVEAIEVARKKCTEAHSGECGVTNAVPVQVP